MTAFPAFLIYSLTALVIAGFEVQAVLLSRLSLFETILYCTAKVLIALGILYASIQYRIFKAKKMWGYVIVAALFLSAGSLYSMFNTFSGRFAVSLESGQKQDADIGESAALQAAALQKSAAAQANTQASQRYATSDRKGSLWAQVSTAKDASRNADQSATLASRAAALKRDAGVTEQQVLALVSPWQPLPTMMVTAAWFAIILELLNLLAAAGAADYIVSRWGAGKAAGQPSNVVPLPSPTSRRRNAQSGRMAIDDAPQDAPGHAPRVAPAAEADRTRYAPENRTPEVQKPGASEVHGPENSGALPGASSGANPGAVQITPNGPLTDAEYATMRAAILSRAVGTAQRSIKTVYRVGWGKAAEVQQRLLTERLIVPAGKGYKLAT